MDSIENQIMEQLDYLISADYCGLCDVEIINERTHRDHFNGRRHQQNQQSFVDLKRFEQNNYLPENTKLFCKPCNENIDDRSKHNGTEAHQMKAECYCELCHIYAPSKNHTWDHLKGRQHNNKLKNKGLLPIDGEFSPFCSSLSNALKKQMLIDYCKICYTDLPNIKRAVAHYISKSHEEAVEKWLQFKPNEKTVNQPEPVGKVAEELDGTSFADGHFEEESHNKKLAFYCEICEVSNATSELLQAHNKSTLHLEKVTLNDISVVTTWPPKFPDLIMPTNYAGHFARDLSASQAQISTKASDEINKAEKVTGESIDEEINSNKYNFKELIFPCENWNFSNAPEENEQKTNSKSDFLTISYTDFVTLLSTTCFYDNKVQEKSTKEDDGNLKTEFFSELEKLVQKLYYSKQVPYNLGLKYLQKVNKEIDEIIIEDKEKEEFFREFDAYNNFNNGKSEAIESEKDSFCENTIVETNFENLLKDINNRKQEAVEIVQEEILSEIECLLKIIDEIKEKPILEEVLGSLKDFNEELDSEIFQIETSTNYYPVLKTILDYGLCRFLPNRHN